MNKPNQDAVADYFSDPEKLTRLMGEAVQDALRTHKLLGHSIVVWRDGKVVTLPPEEIPLKDEPPKSNGSA